MVMAMPMRTDRQLANSRSNMPDLATGGELSEGEDLTDDPDDWRSEADEEDAEDDDE